MTTTATDSAKPERIYEPLQFELHDAPEDVKAYSLMFCLTTGELITNDTLMDAITMGLTMLPRVAPTPGARVRITELLTDEVRHCYMNDHLARALGGDPTAVSYFAPTGDVTFASSMASAASPAAAEVFGDSFQAQAGDAIQSALDGSSTQIPGGFEGLSAMAELITAGLTGATKGLSGSFDSYLWTMFAVFNTCIDRVAGMMIEDTINSSFGPLARMNRSIHVDEAGHAQAGFHHLRDVCATKEGREEAQLAVDAIWSVSLAMFDMLPPQHIEESIRLGLMEHTHAELRERYVEVTVPLLEGLDLCVPAAA